MIVVVITGLLAVLNPYGAALPANSAKASIQSLST